MPRPATASRLRRRFHVSMRAASSSVAASASSPCTVCSPPAPRSRWPRATASASCSARRPMPRPAAASSTRARDMNGCVAPAGVNGVSLEANVTADQATQSAVVDRFLRDALGVEPHRGGGERLAVSHADDHQSMLGQRRHPRCAAEQRGPINHRHFVGRQRDRAYDLAASESARLAAGLARPIATPVCIASATAAPADSHATASTATTTASRSPPRIDEPRACGAGDDVTGGGASATTRGRRPGPVSCRRCC